MAQTAFRVSYWLHDEPREPRNARTVTVWLSSQTLVYESGIADVTLMDFLNQVKVGLSAFVRIPKGKLVIHKVWLP